MTASDKKALNCPKCGEPVLAHWKICPACETRLASLKCPACGRPVKDNWKRCPECDVRLLCPDCGRRLPDASGVCPHCTSSMPAATGSPAADFIEPVTGIQFIRVSGGSFMMGDTFGDGIKNELPVHEVSLTSFYISRCQVTQAQWGKVMAENPAAFKGDHRPVEQASWNEVQIFLKKLEELNREPCNFRLPTEAEWEYAARSGGKAEKYAGADDPAIPAWFAENSDEETHPVGLKRPNGLGLYDMSGNVWEWCQDVFDEKAYIKHSSQNPLHSAKTTDRVIRGGGWNVDAWSIRCTRRMGFPQDYFGPALGFRVVREAKD